MIRKRTIITLLLFLLAVAAVTYLLVSFFSPAPTAGVEEKVVYNFTLIETGRVGDGLYAVYSHSGSGRLTMASLSRPPVNDIYILEQKGVGDERFADFVDSVKGLEKYGMKVRVVGPAAAVKDGIYLIPSGAMPIYAINNLRADGAENLTIVYIGDTGLAIRATVRKEDWYSRLNADLKSRIKVMNTTSDALLDKGTSGLLGYLAENRWNEVSKKEVNITGAAGRGTSMLGIGDGGYARILYSLGDKTGKYDVPIPQPVEPISIGGNVLPWEEGWAEVSLNKTNGTAYLNFEKDGVLVKRIKLERVSEESYFRKSLQLPEPGDYIVKVMDNSGMAANGVLHVKDVSVTLKEVRDTYYYVFAVSVDGEPLKDARITVGLKNSTSAPRPFAVTDGTLTVPAKLANNRGTFVFDLLGGTVEVPVQSAQENIWDVYIRYGPFGLVAVIVVFLLARLGRRQVYSIRIANMVPAVRREVRLSVSSATELFRSTRAVLKVEGPLKANEFAVGLKRYVTEGADVTEGNVEELLKKMEKRGLVLSWKGYYELVDEGNIKRNAMTRIIRETLIERGIHFKVSGDKFVTKDMDIGFYGTGFRRKAVIVFEDMAELRSTLMNLDDRERSILFLKEFNGLVTTVAIDNLEDVL